MTNQQTHARVTGEPARRSFLRLCRSTGTLLSEWINVRGVVSVIDNDYMLIAMGIKAKDFVGPHPLGYVDPKAWVIFDGPGERIEPWGGERWTGGTRSCTGYPSASKCSSAYTPRRGEIDPHACGKDM